jgi:hypothetical protein
MNGNFFTDPLPQADVSSWDIFCMTGLLEKAYAALIVYDALDEERRENAFGLLMSLNMLIESKGGFDYTGADCQAWIREAGLDDAPRGKGLGLISARSPMNIERHVPFIEILDEKIAALQTMLGRTKSPPFGLVTMSCCRAVCTRTASANCLASPLSRSQGIEKHRLSIEAALLDSIAP